MERWTSQESGSAIGDAFLERISEVASTGVNVDATVNRLFAPVAIRKLTTTATRIVRGPVHQRRLRTICDLALFGAVDVTVDDMDFLSFQRIQWDDPG